MKLVRLRISHFRSFGHDPTEILLDDTTFLLGPNGSGKTVVLQALARMFSLDPALRRIRRSDFHVPSNETPGAGPDERTLWIEADFEFPELLGNVAEDESLVGVPGSFTHMQLIEEEGPVQIRFRLAASIDQDENIEETFTYVTKQDEQGNPLEQSKVSRQDRAAIQVHYLPARRDPADHISYSTNALLGRILRSADWGSERDQISELTESISEALAGNAAIIGVADALTNHWGELHTGSYFANPAVSFSGSELETLLRHASVSFTPGHGELRVDFSRLSDGQQSLLYVSLVLASHEIGVKVLSGEIKDAFDVAKLRPAVFTLIAIEEPENSLSPHYLGRVIHTLSSFAKGRDAQALIATHAPALLRRVPPESIRYLRLSPARTTIVKQITLPADEEAQKFVREGVQAFPELYFSRLVVLGEGDSEEIVLPRLLSARGILADDASVSFAPLGGRHVNHFWRLLHDLGIPHVTLLDLDLARHQGGWGRIKYAATQLLRHTKTLPSTITQKHVDGIPKWNGKEKILSDDQKWLKWLEDQGVFFSTPLDLDFMMIEAYREAYDIDDALDIGQPDNDTVKAVLGKSHGDVEGQYAPEQLDLFGAYHQRFKLGSKPTSHLRAMANLDDEQIVATMPAVLQRMFDQIELKLAELPE